MPKTIKEELEYIRKRNKGLLDPVKVVAYARSPKTALHNKFEWDDTLAAEQYRIDQARHIIRLELTVVHQKEKMEPLLIRTYFSLPGDRKGNEENGYRLTNDIMSDEVLKGQLLEEAKNEMRIFRRKYETLKELSIVFEAMDKVL